MGLLVSIEMTDQDLRKRVSQVCKDQWVRKIELFGSRARSAELEGRDYDFVATFEDSPPEDVLRNGEAIGEFAEGMDFERYCRDAKTRLGVERSFPVSSLGISTEKGKPFRSVIWV